jgi:hypothetical protein
VRACSLRLFSIQYTAAASAKNKQINKYHKLSFKIIRLLLMFLRSVVNCKFDEHFSLINPALNAHILIIAFDLSENSAGTVRIKRVFSK